MKLGTIDTPSGPRPAIATPTGGVPLNQLPGADRDPVARSLATATTMEDVLRLGPPALAWLRDHTRATELPGVVRTPRWRAPLMSPQKICCIGLNYADHCREQGLEPPKSPVLFAKYPSTIIGPGERILWDPKFSTSIDWEAELAVVIGTKARRVPREKAMDHVAGYTCANDVTARDIQKGDGQFVRGKSPDTFCPIGPWIVTKDEVADPHNLRIQCRVNGAVKQASNTRNLIFHVDHLVSFLSQAFTLLPGDLILTGTPGGVGMHRKPPEWLKPGDAVEVEIEGVGVLRNGCGHG